MNKKHYGLHPVIFRFSRIAAALVFAPNIAAAAILFESDSGSNSIQEYTPDGSEFTFVGGLNSPEGLAFDASGNLFEADGGFIINKITPIPGPGSFTKAGSQSTFATSVSAVGLAFDAFGNLFESDSLSDNVSKFTPTGSRTTFASGFRPVGLAFDASGNLFAADFSGHIYKFTPDGTRTTFASGLNDPWGLAFDASGNLFETDEASGNIYEFTPAGARSTFATGLAAPRGLAFDASGNLFEADGGSNTIYEFTPTGTRSIFAIGVDQPTFLAFAAVPEPTTGLLAVLACGMICCWKRSSHPRAIGSHDAAGKATTRASSR